MYTSVEHRKWWFLYTIGTAMLQMIGGVPLPQDPSAMLQDGMMSAIGNAVEYAQRAVPNGDNASSNEDQNRRKRAVMSVEEMLGEMSLLPLPVGQLEQNHAHVHRGKRSPCRGGTTPGTPSDIVDGEEAATDARKTAQRKAKAKARKAKSKKTLQRRRRQADEQLEDVSKDINEFGQKLSERAKRFTEDVQSVWESIVNSMGNVVEQVKQTFGNKGSNDAQT